MSALIHFPLVFPLQNMRPARPYLFSIFCRFFHYSSVQNDTAKGQRTDAVRNCPAPGLLPKTILVLDHVYAPLNFW